MKHFYFKNSSGVILHPYLPITATSLHRPVNSVPWVAVVERFDCTLTVLVDGWKNCEGSEMDNAHSVNRGHSFSEKENK